MIANEEERALPGIGLEYLNEQGLLEPLKQGTVYWLDSADFGPTIGTGGIATWELLAYGVAGHSGMPHNCVNAIELAMATSQALCGVVCDPTATASRRSALEVRVLFVLQGDRGRMRQQQDHKNSWVRKDLGRSADYAILRRGRDIGASRCVCCRAESKYPTGRGAEGLSTYNDRGRPLRAG